MKNNFYGLRRVPDDEPGKLPQNAWKLDNSIEIFEDEVLLDVEMLNIDSASFKQLSESNEFKEELIAKRILQIVDERGKMHNPVTSSGGVLMGTVSQIGEAYKGDLRVGDKVVTLGSLSQTPLKIDYIKKIVLRKEQVFVEGKAILFQSSLFHVLNPEDDYEELISVLDVAGAPAQVYRMAEKGSKVFILGAAGKSGKLSLLAARKKIGKDGIIIALVYSEKEKELIQELNLADHILVGDATNPISVLEKFQSLNLGYFVDLSINCTNVPNSEMSPILVTKNRGRVYYFNMATSFTAAALGAEALGKDVDLIIGNGYCENHAEIALNVFKELKEEMAGGVNGIIN